MGQIFMFLFLGVISVLVSVIAIVVSTSAGSNWAQSTWEQMADRRSRPEEPDH